MSKIAVGKKVPNFKIAATSGHTVNLSDLKGKVIVLYFYPKDSTPGCTIESQNFRDAIRKFRARNTTILGISRDTLKSHEKFKATECLPFELLSDEDEKLCTLFDVIKEKNMYGKKVMGIERSMFLIDAEGILRKEWRKVSVQGHVDEVLEAVKEL
jgi:peroxiredoxin Q/BCP